MNKDNYKKAIDQIHPSEELKKKTLEKILEKQKRKIPYMRYMAACAMILVVCIVGQQYLKIEKHTPQNQLAVNNDVKEINAELPRFKSMQELKSKLKENDAYRATNGVVFESALDSAVMKGDSANVESEQSVSNYAATQNKEFSTTNVQVENVDEADTVKTDGDYIYHVTDSKVLIVKAETLEIVTIIDENANQNETNRRFGVQEIFINGNILVALGNEYKYQEIKARTSIVDTVESIVEDVIVRDTASIRDTHVAKAMIYNIEDKSNPVLKREIELDGNYSNSRMIGDYVYFISNKNAYYKAFMADEEILPFYKDTAISEENTMIACTDIAYFEGTNDYTFTMIAGFNIHNQDEVFLETFLGASRTVYASEDNLYLAQVNYNNLYYRAEKSTIYKFNLDEGKVVLQCKGEVKGNLNNQFSMDEYDGNLRIATTAYDEENEYTNQLFILDKDLKEIGKIENLAAGEKIYAVRFIGKIGYIVTFKEIDPLFVIDLSDPTAPKVKGELKIPGYSSYLHPYDETHIIGIGYNTKSNGYGGVTNSNMKMSMFDVSDLENPKEMFSIDIGDTYAYSEITYNHKALFYYKSKNLIGFPVTLREYSSSRNTNNFILFKIDLENGFEEYSRIKQKIDYRTNIDRAIYIEDHLYTLSETKIVCYDLNTMEKQNEINLEKYEKVYEYENEEVILFKYF